MHNWLEHAIVYEIYPQSFYDTNGDGVGDLAGIIEKLDYIENCGFNTIWLNPINASSFRDAGYDVTDFYRIDPRYGDNEEYRRLCEEAHRRGMRVIFDLVAGHTSVDHPWFIESAKDEINPFSNRYIWTDATFDNESEGISGYSERDGNYITNFFWSQPALNYGYAHPDPSKPWQLPVTHPDCIETKEELKRIIAYWMEMGTDAFRVDMAASLIKGDEDGSFMVAFWHEIRKFMESMNPDCLLIAEWGFPSDAIKAGFHCDFLLHSGNSAYTSLFRHEEGRNTTKKFLGHSYFSKDGKGDIREYLNRYLFDLEQVKGKGYIGMITGNHDIPRLAHGRTVEEIKAAMVFLFTMPGVPFVYFGDEIGMDYIAGLRSKEGGYNRTGSRTPMQWDMSKHHGFSQSDSPYLPTDERPGAPTVLTQINEPNSLLSFMRQLIGLRKHISALHPSAEFEIIEAGYPFIFRRKCEGKSLLIAINPSNSVFDTQTCDDANVILSQNILCFDNVIQMKGVSFFVVEENVIAESL